MAVASPSHRAVAPAGRQLWAVALAAAVLLLAPGAAALPHPGSSSTEPSLSDAAAGTRQAQQPWLGGQPPIQPFSLADVDLADGSEYK